MELVLTKDGSWTARHPQCEQEFHSLEGARFEAENLYIKSSGLLDFLPLQPCSVLDVGMGLGYNALSTISAWTHCADANHLTLISVEKDPDLVKHINEASGPWQENWSDEWQKTLRAPMEFDTRTLKHPNGKSALTWKIFTVEAASDFSWSKDLKLDFIWQDPFSLPHNPELWTPEWFTHLRNLSAPNATLMTYSVARGVKNALNQAGWSWELFRTPGRKRHWLRAKNHIQ